MSRCGCGWSRRPDDRVPRAHPPPGLQPPASPARPRARVCRWFRSSGTIARSGQGCGLPAPLVRAHEFADGFDQAEPSRDPVRGAVPARWILMATGRPISVPASQAVIRPCARGSMTYRRTRPSAADRLARTRPASRSSLSCRVVAGRLRPSSVARIEGRRGTTASAAMIRRLVGSARSSMPGPFRFGMSMEASML